MVNKVIQLYISQFHHNTITITFKSSFLVTLFYIVSRNTLSLDIV